MRELILECINEIRLNQGKELLVLDDVLHDADLRNDLGMDSLDLAVFTVKIEESTGIDIFEEGIVTTLNEVLQRTGGNQ